MTLKMAVVAPMPSVSESSATSTNARLRANERSAYVRSRAVVPNHSRMDPPAGGLDVEGPRNVGAREKLPTPNHQLPSRSSWELGAGDWELTVVLRSQANSLSQPSRYCSRRTSFVASGEFVNSIVFAF